MTMTMIMVMMMIMIMVMCRERRMYYHGVEDCHWTYYDHNNFLCFGQ